jgi:two-component system, cell cycle sensor histidine kinase and response regulator CckA
MAFQYISDLICSELLYSVILIDEETDIVVFANPSAARLAGDELLHKKINEIFSDTDLPDDNLNVISRFSSVLIGSGIPVIVTAKKVECNNKKFIMYEFTDNSDSIVSSAFFCERMESEKTISYIYELFSKNDDLNMNIDIALEKIGKVISADRVYLFQSDPLRKTMSNTHEWCIKSEISQMDNLQNLPLSDFKWWIDKLEKNEPIAIDNVSDMDIDAVNERRTLEEQGIKSLLCLPLFVNKSIEGFIGVDFVYKFAQIDAANVDMLRIVSDIIGSFLERNRAFEYLKNNLSFLRTLIDTVPEPIFYKNLDNIINGCNEAFAEIIAGDDILNVEGKSISDIKVISDESVSAVFSDKEKELISKGAISPFEVSLVCSDGVKRDFFVYNSLFFSGDEVSGILLILLDITEKNKRGRELIRIEKELAESEKTFAIGQLASGVAHEFNNTLAVIKSTAQLIALEYADELPRDVVDSLKDIDASTSRGADIVKNLMILAKPSEDHKEILDMSQIITTVIKLLQTQLKNENVKVVRKFENTSPILVNRNQMHQVFLNLFINSRHALFKRENPQIVITISEKSGSVYILFRDNGIGISAKNLNKIFLPFFTTKGASSTDTYNIKGTGLGLSVTNSLVVSNGGAISVNSKEGEYTEFTLVFPAVKYDETQVELPVEPELKSDNHNLTKIAIIDDEEIISANIAELLKLSGFESIKRFSDSRYFIENFSKDDYDIIISDFSMPGMNGEELYKAVRLKDKSAGFILITGGDDSYIGNLGDMKVIRKPFDIKCLLNAVKEML